MTKDPKNISDINSLLKQLDEIDKKNAQERAKLDQMRGLAGEDKMNMVKISEKEKVDDIGILEKRMTAFETEFKSKSEALLDGNKRMNQLLVGVILVTIIAIISFFLVLVGYWGEIYFHYRQQEEKLWKMQQDYERVMQQAKISVTKK